MTVNKELDALTAIKLGQALFNFLARKNEESDLDVFQFEDAGVGIQSGFVEIDARTLQSVLELINPETEGDRG